MAADTFDREQIRALLREVGMELSKRKQSATIYVVGGAAMALLFDARRLTRDVDAAFKQGRESLEPVVAMVADRHGLPHDWLNSRAAAFVSSEPDVDASELTFPGLRVLLASPEHLIAMKLRALRPQDAVDLDTLFRDQRIEAPEQAAAICERLFDESSIGYDGPEESLLSAQLVFDRAEKAGRPISPAPVSSAGQVWVSPHLRRGRLVQGHWRRRRSR